ncbi:MAG: DUF2330 domain-containing protein, partial [Leptospiraceae bacterium]|nr:DUF2330 domain-containing protein [Leptospiraceae bacterium]
MKPFSILVFLSILNPIYLYSFCGFFVAQADSKLFNNSSRVVLIRNEQKTTIGMMNDYKGDLKNFALVVPVPEVIKKSQIETKKALLFDKLDAYTAPRLVDYFDPNPCPDVSARRRASRFSETASARGLTATEEARIMPVYTPRELGITIEESYTVGEYDIEVLSAKYSSGLETYLLQNKYKIPEGASKAFKPYIKQDMKFFVAKVSLDTLKKGDTQFLSPLFFHFETPRFMLPIRLGMINSEGEQDLFVFTLSRIGRVETKNYRTRKLPSDTELPEYIENDFPNLYKTIFKRIVEKDKLENVYTEYVWNLNQICDPCTASPYSKDDLEELGVDWLSASPETGYQLLSDDVFLTRLHLRYTEKTFPEDLEFQETPDKDNFQTRFIVHHPYSWHGDEAKCECFREYMEKLQKRKKFWTDNLHSLTGMSKAEITAKMNAYVPDRKKRNERLGKIWTGSSPFFRPVPIQYSN